MLNVKAESSNKVQMANVKEGHRNARTDLFELCHSFDI